MTKANHLAETIATVVAERDEALQECESLRELIISMVVYLNSPKFHADSTVQVTDILTRLRRF